MSIPNLPYLRTIFFLLFLTPVASTFAEDRHLPQVDIQLLEEVGRAAPDAEIIVTGVKYDAELKHHGRSDGFRGRIIIEWEVWLRTQSAVEQYSRLSVSSSDIRNLKEVEVEVRSLDGWRRNSFDRNDLNWVDIGSSSAGIVSLDTENKQTAIPTLRVDDLLYVRQIIEVKGMHGLPIITLGSEDIPVLYDAYTLSLPADHELKVSLIGEEGASLRVSHTSEEKRGRRVFTWALERDVEHTADEVRVTPQVTTISGNPPDDSFTVGETWTSVGRSYRNRISKYLLPDDEIAAKAAELTATCESDSQRATVLYEYLQENTRYLGFFDGLDGIFPEKAVSVHELKYGDCKGLAAYLVALLTAVEIEAHPALVRTASLGFLDPTMPNMTQFNHMIVWADIGTDGMWLDATVDHCPAGMIVSQDAASEVLLLRSGHEGLRMIPAEAWKAGTLFYEVEGDLGADFKLECAIMLSATGLAATWQSYSSGQAGGDLGNAVEHLLMPRTIGMRVVEYGASTGDEGPLWTCLVRSESPLPQGGGTVFLPAVLPPMPRLKDVGDLSTEPNRREEWVLTLPPGWIVTEDEQTVDAGGMIWYRRVWQEDGRLRLVRNLTWNPASRDTTGFGEAIREIVGRDSGFIKISTGDLR